MLLSLLASDLNDSEERERARESSDSSSSSSSSSSRSSSSSSNSIYHWEITGLSAFAYHWDAESPKVANCSTKDVRIITTER